MATLYFRGLSSVNDWNSNKWGPVGTSPTAGTLPPPGPLDIAVIDSNSITLSNPLRVPTNVTIAGLQLTNTISARPVLSLAANMQINGDFDLAAQGSTILGNGFTISVGNGITNFNYLRLGNTETGLNNGTASTGTLTLKLNGPGTQVLKTNTGVGVGSVGYFTLRGVANNTAKRIIFEINKPSGLVVLGGGNGLLIQNTEFKYVNISIPNNISGRLTAENCTINSGPIIFNSLYLRGTNNIETTDVNTKALFTDTSNAIIISTSGKGINVYESLFAFALNSGSFITTLANPSFIKFVGTVDGSINFGTPSSTNQYIGMPIIFNKTSPAKVTLPPTMYFGSSDSANSTWTQVGGSGLTDGTNTTLYIRSVATNTTLDTNGNETNLNKLVIEKTAGNLTHNITLNSNFKSEGTVEIQTFAGSNTSFLGNSGFNIQNFTATSGTVTLKALNEYIVSGGLFTMTGLINNRTVLKSDTSVNNNGSITGSTLTFTSATNLTGYRISQNNANTGNLKRLPVGLIFPPMDITNSSFLAEVVSGSGSTWTLDKAVSTAVTTRGLTAGLPAYLTLEGCTTNISNVSVYDIDSSSSTSTILANNSTQNTIPIPNPNLWRTVNWTSSLPVLPLVTVAYIE
jgi:hypothetical protein